MQQERESRFSVGQGVGGRAERACRRSSRCARCRFERFPAPGGMEPDVQAAWCAVPRLAKPWTIGPSTSGGPLFRVVQI